MDQGYGDDSYTNQQQQQGYGGYQQGYSGFG